MKKYPFTTARHPRCMSIRFACLAALISLLSSITAWGQQLQQQVIQKGRGNTPRQVAEGTAKLIQPYAPASKLRLAISIKAPKMAEEEKFLKELQDKNSPNFRKYLTPEQWNARFAPSAQDEQAVVDWATSRGLTVLARYPNRLMVNVEGTVDAIQRAFNIKINQYQVDGAVEFSNDHDPQLPANLEGIIEYVDGLNSMLLMHPANSSIKATRGPDYSPGPFRQNGEGVRTQPGTATAKPAAKTPKLGDGGQITNGFLDPSDIWSSNLYDYDALMAQGHCCNPLNNSGGSPVQTTIGLANAGNFANSDVLSFASLYGLQFQGNRIYVGGGALPCCDVETTLDFEWSTATSNSLSSPDASSTILDYQAANGFGDFGSVFQTMVNDNAVRIVNISYGLNESYLNGYGLVSAWHSIFNQMLGQGMTIMAAAGDSGATAGCGDSLALLYPGSDPDVVSVGGTQVELYSNGDFYSEVAWTGGTGAGSCSHNGGGTGGGCSALFAAPGYQSNPACGAGSRSVPDIAINAATGQNVFVNGSLSGWGGTSISSPMMTGFVAQADAYLLAIGHGGAPLGEVNYAIYYQGNNPGGEYASPHYPFYDITSGCNSNDITIEYGLTPYCAGTGFDLVSGWGSFNALQLSWAINSYWVGAFDPPTVTFSGPAHTQGADNWYNTDQTVSWSVASNAVSGLNPTGVAGFSQAWDAYISDPYSEATPGSGNAFYSGPQFPNATSGYLQLSWAGQGCHYATVDAWDNAGYTSGNQFYFYLCYDTIAPTISATNSPAANSFGYNKQTVKVTLSASDPGSGASGIKTTYYGLNSACSPSNLGACSVYSGPISVSAAGFSYIYYFTRDNAGNNSATSLDEIFIDEVPPVTTAALAGALVGSDYESAVKITLSATDNYSGVHSTTYSFDGGAQTAYTAPLTITAPGSHNIKFFSVDYASNTETTKSVSFVLVSPTNTSVTSSANPSTYGESVTFTAKVTPTVGGSPAGTITFKAGSTTINTATVNSSGEASVTTGSLSVGTHSIVATYNPSSGNYLTSASAVLSQVVKAVSTTTTVTSSLNPSRVGQSVTFTAKVTPSTGAVPSGTVTFKAGSTTIGTETLNSSGDATVSTTGLSIGTHSIVAVYNGSTDDLTSTSAILSQTVNQVEVATTTTLTTSPNPSSFGSNVTFTAKVTPVSGVVPTGTVSFFHGNTLINSATLNGSGVATLVSNSLTTGVHSVHAVYNGSIDDFGSTSATGTQTVNQDKTTTIVTTSPNPSTFGKSVTFTAKVTAASGPIATGTVTFVHGSTQIGVATLNSSGVATLASSILTPGPHSIYAVYNGSTDDLGSTSAILTQTVEQIATTTTLTSSLNPSTLGKSVTFTAKVTPASGAVATGTVTFKNGTATLGTGTLNSSGVATVSTTGLSVGTHSIDAVYNGSTDDLTSTSASLSQVVNQ